MRKSTTGGHVDEVESSQMLAIHPDLVKVDAVTLRLQNEFFKESLAPVETKIK